MASKKGKYGRDDAKRAYWTAGDGLVLVDEMIKSGMLDGAIAEQMRITQKTLIDWKKKYPVFGNLFLIGRGVGVIQVRNAMMRSATGFHEKEQVIDNTGKKQIVNKFIPPNVTAQIFLMKNWAPSDYKDKWDVDVNGKLPVVLSGDDEVAD